MARNSLAGKHPSYKKRGMSPEQIKKKVEYDTKYHKTPRARKYRAALNKANRDAGTYGNKDGKDRAHSADGKSTRSQSQSKNRGNNRPKKRSTKAPK
jgi:hypothetical protein